MSGKAIGYALELRVFSGEGCMGPGLAELMSLVREKKSIRKATAEMDMAYSKAWKLLTTAEKEFGFPLVRTETGGAGGGGSGLTAEGERLLDAYLTFRERITAAADEAMIGFRDAVSDNGEEKA